MSNVKKPRTRENILNDIKIVKNAIKPQFEEVEKFLTEVRPKLVEEKQKLDIKLEKGDYVIEDIKRLFDLHTLIFEEQPRINNLDEIKLKQLYSELANINDIKNGGKRRKTKRKSLKKKKKTMKKKQRKTKRKSRK